MSETHKPGVFKQSNKAHNSGKHRSKGASARQSNGKVDVKVLSRKRNRLMNRQDKHNQKEQLRRQKRLQVMETKRSRGVQGSPPFLVSVLPSNTDEGEAKEYMQSLFDGCQHQNLITATKNEQSTFVNCSRFKQRFEFIFPSSVIGHLDANKASDCLLMLVSIDDHLDQSDGDDDEAKRDWLLNERATRNLDNVYNQGLSNVLICCKGLSAYPVKKQSEVKKYITTLFETKFADVRVHSLDSAQDMLMVLRLVGSQKMNKVMYREIRSHMFVSEASFVASADDHSTGDLQVSGYLRGPFITANQLIHIPTFGNFQITQITSLPDPYPLVERKKTENGHEDLPKVLSKADGEGRESLECYVVEDGDGEEEEEEEGDDECAMVEDDTAVNKDTTTKLVPKGFSKYQAAWLEEEEDDDDDDEDEDGVEMKNGDDAAGDADDVKKDEDDDEEDDDDEEMETVTETGQTDECDDQYDEDEDAKDLQRYKDARLNEMFPDEVDTPFDVSARIRFNKYRGMKSFRTSPWDSSTGLPAEYSKIVRFNHFDDVRRRLVKTIIKKNKEEDEDEDDDEAKQVRAGAYVSLHATNVSASIKELLNSREPIITHALLPFEQNISVVHFLIRRCHGDDLPIKSKQPMIFHVGCHRFKARPIYSQHSGGDRHKFERFFPASATMVATVYAPLTFPPTNVLMFRPHPIEGDKLVGTGSLLSVNPDRMIIKKCILSGHPFKINTNSAVIRYMFFNPEDVRWFSPIELRSKYGRKGRIIEPIGTHGHMKCKFNKQLTSQDTVLMNLYKRVFPTWNDYSNVKT